MNNDLMNKLNKQFVEQIKWANNYVAISKISKFDHGEFLNE